MSSTNRSNDRDLSRKLNQDYYCTPVEPIIKFLNAFQTIENIELNKLRVLDPCAGGDENNKMSYPLALSYFNVFTPLTMDIRPNSLATIKIDYLLYKPNYEVDLIITNPPFNLALDIIKKAMIETTNYTIMLLRLNFWGSKQRKSFFQFNMPKYCFIHSQRMSFNNRKQHDSIEYAHFVWQKSYNNPFTHTYLI